MDAKEIIAFIQNAEKKTPVKVYLKEKKPVAFPDCKVFGTDSKVIFGDWKIIEPILKENADWYAVAAMLLLLPIHAIQLKAFFMWKRRVMK